MRIAEKLLNAHGADHIQQLGRRREMPQIIGGSSIFAGFTVTEGTQPSLPIVQGLQQRVMNINLRTIASICPCNICMGWYYRFIITS